MSTKQLMAYCQNEGRDTLHIQETPNHLLHLILSILTGGIWIIVWLILMMTTDPATCTFCGTQQGGLGATIKVMFSILIYGSLFMFLLYLVF